LICVLFRGDAHSVAKGLETNGAHAAGGGDCSIAAMTPLPLHHRALRLGGRAMRGNGDTLLRSLLRCGTSLLAYLHAFYILTVRYSTPCIRLLPFG
jgi:hypothetical protein